MRSSDFQIFRWGIPGWIFLMTILFLISSLYEFKITNVVGEFNSPSVLTGITALFLSLGIPIGYVLYQLYFFIKWSIKPKFLKLCNKEKDNNIYMTIKDIDDFHCQFTYNANEDWVCIENYYYRLLTTVVPIKEIALEILEIRINQLSSRTSRIHGLGASVWGLILAVIIFCILFFNKINYYSYGTLFLIVLSILITYANYKSQNKNGFIQMNSLLKDILNATDKK